MLMGIICLLVFAYLMLVIFKWDWVKRNLIRGRNASMYRWIENNWGETAERLILGGICALVLVCGIMAIFTGQA